MSRETNPKSLLIIIVFLLAMLSTSAVGRIIYVDDDGPADFNNIQAAIDDSNDGDIVIVRDGTYTGEGNRHIDFKGKTITVQSENGANSCIIDKPGAIGFTFHNEEDANSILEGFTISRAFALEAGGAICCSGSSPTIRNCIIRDNRVGCINYNACGGGICCSYHASPTIVNCIIMNNRVSNIGCDGHAHGGGIYSYCSNPAILNCTISNNGAGSEDSSVGGGIFCYNGNMIISHCKISGNGAKNGGGIYCWLSNVSVSNCDITGNEVSDNGGGICSYDSSVSIVNCILSGNDADEGGGICSYDGSVSIINCTISGNEADDAGGGIYVEGVNVTITNSILLRNFDYNIYSTKPNEPIVTFSNVQGGWLGEGNIDSDPCFADVNNGDYHLKSLAGRWDPAKQAWIRDDVTSLCIDAGDPASPIGLEPFPNGGIINMGAYGGTEEASKSYFGEPVCETIIAGDINGDCKVDFKDFALMALHWLRDENQ